MVLRQGLARNAPRALRNPSSSVTPATRRGLAAPASGSYNYLSGEAAGVKFASRSLAGPTSTLALVAKAGTRYQPLPGLAEGLEKFAFKNTKGRSALRLQREAELFGATLFSYHTRESVVIGAKFFRDDLPYFVEVLKDVATTTRYQDHEFVEQIRGQIQTDQSNQLRNVASLALASAHSLAFHRGLGEPIYPTSSSPLEKYLSHDAIAAYSTLAYRKPNIAVVANGAEHSHLQRWVSDFFPALRSSPPSDIPGLVNEDQSKYYGGEERIAHGNGNAMVLAFPGSSSLTGGFHKPEVAVLAALLGGQSSIKWSPGFSLLSKPASDMPGLSIATKSSVYSDAGLLHVAISGSNADYVRAGAEWAIYSLRQIAEGKVSDEDLAKARASAKFEELEHGQEVLAGLELSGAGLVNGSGPYQLDESADLIGKVDSAKVREAAKNMLTFKACVSTVGDLWVLPYAEELGVQV